jgi:hypothetical protein
MRFSSTLDLRAAPGLEDLDRISRGRRGLREGRGYEWCAGISDR